MEHIILAIETSCDETSVAVLKNGREVLSNIIYSQIDLHKVYGGVVPEIASRKHIEKLPIIIEEALGKSQKSFSDIDMIAVTYGPGLVGALLVGVSYAKALSYSLKVPLTPVHHIHGHIAANFIAHKELRPPFVCLIVSGGHSHIVYMKEYGEFEIMGKTRDDAAGEAFDKIARVMGLGYPGGPLIDQAARSGQSVIEFPRVHFQDGSIDFSFSGVKTAVINYLHKLSQTNAPYRIPDVACSFQDAVTDILVENTMKAAEMKKTDTVVMAGGVAANSALREKMQNAVLKKGIALYYPPVDLCTDNAAMIGCAAYFEAQKGRFAGLDLNAIPYLKL